MRAITIFRKRIRSDNKATLTCLALAAYLVVIVVGDGGGRFESDRPYVFLGNVRRVVKRGRDAREQLKAAVRQRSPVHFKSGTLNMEYPINRWTSLRRWQEKSYITTRLPVFDDVVDGRFNMNWDPDRSLCLGDDEIRNSIKSCVGKARYQVPSIDMPTEQFFDEVSEGRPLMYMAPLGDEFARVGLDADLADWRDIAVNETSQCDHRCFIWIGGGDIVSHTHYDASHNTYVQISGRKTFVLSAPRTWSRHYLFPRGHPGNQKSRVDWEKKMDEATKRAFPRWKHIDAWIANLEPGDVLYIPPYWFHQVASTTTSISANVWSLSDEIVAYELALSLGLPDAFSSDEPVRGDAKGTNDGACRIFATKKAAALASFVRNLVEAMGEHLQSSVESAVRDILVDQRYEGDLRSELKCDECPADRCEVTLRAASAFDETTKPYAARVAGALLYGAAERDSGACGCACATTTRREIEGLCDILLGNYLEEVALFVLGSRALCGFFSGLALAAQ